MASNNEIIHRLLKKYYLPGLAELLSDETPMAKLVHYKDPYAVVKIDKFGAPGAGGPKVEDVTEAYYGAKEVKMGNGVLELPKNYCKTGDGMALCMIESMKLVVTKCRFCKKGSKEQCMYLRRFGTSPGDFDHCDNHKAQKAAYLSTDDN